MLDLEPIRAGIKQYGRALVLSEASSCVIDPAVVKEELEENGFRWVEEDGDLYAVPELSAEAKRCLYERHFNEFACLGVIPFSKGRSLAAAAINKVITGEDNLDLFVCTALGHEVVAELRNYCKRSK